MVIYTYKSFIKLQEIYKCSCYIILLPTDIVQCIQWADVTEASDHFDVYNLTITITLLLLRIYSVVKSVKVTIIECLSC